ncbi:helix-turn-helix transcriptional regulator [Exiguobacterium artemiae]|uniref:helix-turn-helix transcriptional regulator n=1 Tax=Exiguobacterium artemiae TaxID=340145 RepID=UPI002964A041|nr:helix-turn-helix transcriptional regulator [Exiguobacterium sibiricum]MDW2886573.1 helix-turn-helix transcriptional regulator [Exiguobacterium sibiricum]
MKNRMKALREARQWSQGELAKALGVSRQTVISIEKERYNPSLELAFSIAALFDCPIEAIFIPDAKEKGDDA